MNQEIKSKNDAFLDWVIQQASKKGVKKIAVENFLGTVSANPNIDAALSNLYMDAGLYKWNAKTVEVIRKGIHKFYKEVAN